MDITLIQVDPATKVVSFKLSPQPIKGIMKITQLVVLSLLNIPGKDALDPDQGGGVPEMFGMNLNPSDYSEIMSELSRRIRKTEKELISNQIGNDADASEKIKELKIISIGPGASLDEIYARIRIINELGQQSDVVI